LYKRWGSGLTLLVALPMLGTLLSISAGMFGIPLNRFIFWAVVGKFGRNLLIVLLFGVILQSLSGALDNLIHPRYNLDRLDRRLL
jgi:membrane protein YqaA with SNARE-associated domain